MNTRYVFGNPAQVPGWFSQVKSVRRRIDVSVVSRTPPALWDHALCLFVGFPLNVRFGWPFAVLTLTPLVTAVGVAVVL